MSKYPLQPLLEHREHKVDAATEELGNAIRQREAAEATAKRAADERKAAEERVNAIRNDEAARLGRGELRAVDLARAGAWEIAAGAEREELMARENAAATEAADACASEGGARAELAQTTAERDVVVKDRGRFDARAAERVLAAEEEAAADAFAARRRR